VAKTHPRADSRDMFVVHDMFRREFKAIPGLVSEVPEGDGAQVTIVADHVVWMVTFLHAHHHGEDLFIWPKLLERVPVKIDPLIFTMEAQHKGLAQALDDLGAKAAGWRKSSAAAERNAVAGAATDLLVLIADHLGLEEREVLPLIEHLPHRERVEAGRRVGAEGDVVRPAQGGLRHDPQRRGPGAGADHAEHHPPRPLDDLFPHRAPGLRQIRRTLPHRRRSRAPRSSLSQRAMTNPDDDVIAELRRTPAR
jgi:hemerythrin-like domain-containing protein